MKLAMLSLENKTIFTPDTMFTHLKGWWKPPPYVIEFWSAGCYFKYLDSKEYEKRKEAIITSHDNAVKDFWRLMVL